MKNIILILFTFSGFCYVNAQNIAQLEQEAKEGKTSSQYKLGMHYCKQKQYSQCVYWNQKIVDRSIEYNKTRKSPSMHISDADAAYYHLAWHYEYGWAVEKNREKALEYFKKSNEEGYHKAPFIVAQMYESDNIWGIDLDKAIEWYLYTTQSYDYYGRKAGLILGEIYETGGRIIVSEKDSSTHIKMYPNIQKDLRKAIIHYREYVDGAIGLSGMPSDAPRIKYKLANWLLEGKLAERDAEKAFDYIKECIEENNNPENCENNTVMNNAELADAMWILSRCYSFGWGTTSNEIYALKWARKAAQNGSSKAMDMTNFGIYGVIVDKNDAPVINKEIEIVRTLNGQKYRVSSDEKGYFFVADDISPNETMTITSFNILFKAGRDIKVRLSSSN